jgi:hypothetical protein
MMTGQPSDELAEGIQIAVEPMPATDPVKLENHPPVVPETSLGVIYEFRACPAIDRRTRQTPAIDNRKGRYRGLVDEPTTTSRHEQVLHNGNVTLLRGAYVQAEPVHEPGKSSELKAAFEEQ